MVVIARSGAGGLAGPAIGAELGAATLNLLARLKRRPNDCGER